MNGTVVFFSGVLLAIMVLSLVGGAKANILTNGDFSTGTLAGWETNDNVIVVDCSGIPEKHTEMWDLSSWNTRLDGSFALLDATRGHLYAKPTILAGSTPTFLSLDYAAWANPVIPDDAGNPYAYGYFYIQTDGVTADDKIYSLTYNEVALCVTDQAINKGVLTGTLNTQNFCSYL